MGVLLLFFASIAWSETKISLVVENKWGFRNAQSVLVEKSKIFVNAAPVAQKNVKRARQLIARLKPLSAAKTSECAVGSYIFEIQESGKSRREESCSKGPEFADKIATFEELKKLTIK